MICHAARYACRRDISLAGCKRNLVSTSSDYSFSVFNDIQITAIYINIIKRYKVTTNEVSNSTGYVKAGLGEYEEGSEVTVTAKSAHYLIFLHWIIDNEIFFSETSYTFIITKDTIVVPVYDIYTQGLVFNYLIESDSYEMTGYTGTSNYDITIRIPEHYNDEIHGLKKVTYIADEAIMHNSNLTKLYIGNGVTHIGIRAFFGNQKLKDVVLSENLVSIGKNAFEACFELTTIHLPTKVELIGKQAFTRLTGLTNITVDSKNIFYETIDGVLFNKGATELLAYPNNRNSDINVSEREYTIPDTVTSIGEYAFDQVYFAELSFTTETTIQTIGTNAFYKTKITKIVIPASVIVIGEYAFNSCLDFTEFTFARGSQLVSIGNHAFYGCSEIENLILPEGLQTIGANAFEACKNLDGSNYPGFVMPNTIVSIGKNAFKDCKKLSGVYIAVTLQEIGNDAFDGCNITGTVYIASVAIIEQLDRDVFGGLIAHASTLYINNAYNEELCDFVTGNYVLNSSNVAIGNLHYNKYTRKPYTPLFETA